MFFEKSVTASAVLYLSASLAMAGPQYLDETGFAVSGYDVVAYFDLPQSEIGDDQPPAVPGKASLTATHNNATFAFSTQENLDKFLANPEKYVPQFDGHCAYGVAVGGKVPANPNLWRIVDDKLYLNINGRVVRKWERDISGNISTAGEIWAGGMEADAASTDGIPWFKSDAPVKE